MQAETKTARAKQEALKAIQDAEGWIGECIAGETAIALAVIAVAKTNMALEARLGELAAQLNAQKGR